MMTVECFKWYDKGCRTDLEKFQLGSPEREYYTKAAGKYLLPFRSTEPEWVLHNFNLVYGVHGTSGFLSLAPFRVINFTHAYNNRFNLDKIAIFPKGSARFMNLDSPASGSLASYFPVDFTIVNKNDSLGWEDFSKVVQGDKYDMYERNQPAPRVYFAKHLRIVPFLNTIRSFDNPRGDVVLVTEEDGRNFSLNDLDFGDNLAMVQEFSSPQIKEDQIFFKISSLNNVLVVVPEQYQKGWSVKIDGVPAKIFPAYYLFIGFLATAGQHVIELKFIPPFFEQGLFVTLLSSVLFFVFWRKLRRESYEKQ